MKFDAAMRILLREELKYIDPPASLHAAIRVLEAAAKVPKADAIKNLNGIFMFCAIHGQTQTIPSIVAACDLLNALPDDTDAKEKV